MRCDDTGHFQSREEEEVGIVRECDVFLLLAFSLEDAQFNNRRWVNRPSISRCWTMLAVQHDGYCVDDAHIWLLIHMLWLAPAAE
jgi:hypothetical protein